jgi:hypothetical protein
MTREPLDWEKNSQSSGLTFEGSVERLRFAASAPKSRRRSPPQITTGFKVTLWVGAIGIIVGTILLSLR